MSLTVLALDGQITDEPTMLARIFGLTGIGLLIAAISTALSLHADLSGLQVASFGGTLLLLFAVMFTRGALSAILFLLFTASEGPLLALNVKPYLLQSPTLVGGVAALTGAIFCALSAYVIKTRKDFTFMGGALVLALLALLGACFLPLFGVPVPDAAIGAGGSILFSLCILFDVSLIIQRGYDDDQYAYAALGLYLDVTRLFIFLLRLFGGPVAKTALGAASGLLDND
jgi:modulator of FtsH protease